MKEFLISGSNRASPPLKFKALQVKFHGGEIRGETQDCLVFRIHSFVTKMKDSLYIADEETLQPEKTCINREISSPRNNPIATVRGMLQIIVYGVDVIEVPYQII